MNNYQKPRPTQFVLVSRDYRTKLKLSENTFTALGKFLLNKFLKDNNLATNEQGMLLLVQQVQHFRQPIYTPQEAINAVSAFVLENYTITKKFGKLPLSKRDSRQLSYIIKKTLETTLEDEIS